MTGSGPLTFTLTRVVDAPREEVFAAWTQKELLEQWMCRDVPSHHAEYTVLEARLGGRYVIEIRLAGGAMYRGSGTFHDFTPPERLAFTWCWESIPALGATPVPESNVSLITVQLDQRGRFTEITLTHALIEHEQARRESEQGWSGCLDVLSDLMAGVQKGSGAPNP